MSVLRIPPKADPDTRACFQDVEQRLSDLEARATGASTSDLMTVRDDLLKLQSDISGQLNGLQLYASQIASVVSGGMHSNNVQAAINELDFRTGLPYDTHPEVFWPMPGCWMSLSGDFTHNSPNGWIPVTMNVANENNNNMADTSNNQIVIRTTGVYNLNATAFIQAGAQVSANSIYLNGADVGMLDVSTSGNITNPILTIFSQRRLAKGDILKHYVYQNSAGNLLVYAARTFFGAQWVRL